MIRLWTAAFFLGIVFAPLRSQGHATELKITAPTAPFAGPALDLDSMKELVKSWEERASDPDYFRQFDVRSKLSDLVANLLEATQISPVEFGEMWKKEIERRIPEQPRVRRALIVGLLFAAKPWYNGSPTEADFKQVIDIIRTNLFPPYYNGTWRPANPKLAQLLDGVEDRQMFTAAVKDILGQALGINQTNMKIRLAAEVNKLLNVWKVHAFRRVDNPAKAPSKSTGVEMSKEELRRKKEERRRAKKMSADQFRQLLKDSGKVSDPVVGELMASFFAASDRLIFYGGGHKKRYTRYFENALVPLQAALFFLELHDHPTDDGSKPLNRVDLQDQALRKIQYLAGKTKGRRPSGPYGKKVGITFKNTHMSK